ncbi:hypothetical protein SNOG_02566 [Parastagonospora nodorum SN15]|uniref:Uncharacterized protein n=1 Tax=Phaeosphaeria nodorum (strain SN15 / ATCC MYA-4574 / FGSC 10173) TaxID=321614 RepID=Q0V098_PHANO|nr:hypothetical protein SNOG_02566 [Parastagonospora nodorum SN15]EAT89297.1 hypothetical protein SNOG_02566 [Parastagonospora nodorum SN15]
MLSALVDISNSSVFTLTFGSLCLWYFYESLCSWYRLRHIPTPSVLASFSYLWLGRHTFSGKQYWVHRELHAEHGPFVRIGPNEVMTDDVSVIKQICSARSAYQRSSWYQTGRFNPYHDNLLSILSTPAHRELKTRLLTAIGSRENPGIEQAIDEQVKTLIRVIRTRYVGVPSKEKQPLLDLGPISLFFTMDVTTRLVFGREIGDMEDETDHSGFLKHVADLWPQMSTSADVPWIRKVIFSPLFLRLLGPKVSDEKGFGKLMALAERHVEERFKTGYKDEVQDMLELKAPLYSRLKEEITSAIRDGIVSSPITFAQAKRLSYLQAVIYEGIRMRTPLLGLWPKWSASDETFLGVFIPVGTCICMNTSALLRSPKLFGQDADIYNPERFVSLDHEARMEMEHHVELAFGSGQWMCAGKNMAFMEINKIIFELLRNFDIQMANSMLPHKSESYGVFLESNMFVKTTENLSR